MRIKSFILLLFMAILSTSTEKFEIIYPRDKSLLGAGHFDFKWTSISNAKNYQLYVNEQLVSTTTSTTQDYYTTKVQKFTAYIQAELTNGAQRKTNQITFYITKKGLAVNSDMGRHLNPLSMNMGWYYTWSPTSPFAYTNSTYKYLEYVPMIWGIDDKEDDHLETVKNAGHMYLLGYNEPDFEDQSNIKPLTAAEHWPKFRGKSRYLGSPVPGLSPTWSSGQWLKDFMAAVDVNSIDLICLHLYYDKFAGAAGAKAFLEDVVDGTYNMFGKPLWITEFAVSGFGYSDASKRSEVDAFLRASVDGLNAREYVERYAWFSFNTDNEMNGASALWTESTGQLTSLGETYVSYGNPEGYDFRQAPPPAVDVTSAVRDEEAYADEVTIGERSYANLLRRSGVTADASSSVNKDSLPALAVDNDARTRWESEWSDEQSMTIDLGGIFYVKQVDVMWQYASARDYAIEISPDGQTFSTAASATSLALVERRSETFIFSSTLPCRYVRIACTRRTTEWGYSIYEAAVYGSEEPDSESDGDADIGSVHPSEETAVTATDATVDGGEGEPLVPLKSDTEKPPEPSFGVEVPDGAGDSIVEGDPEGNSGKEKSGLPPGAVAAIVVVVVVVVVAAVTVTVVVIRRRRMNANDSEPEMMSPDNV